MYVTNTNGVKELDRRAVEEWDIPSAVLMENAGRSATEIINREVPELPGFAVVIAGKGNNGGDGLVIARRLIDSGVDVRTYLLGGTDSLSEESARNARILKRMGGSVRHCGPADEDLLEDIESNPPLIIDAIFGIGIEGALRGDYPALVDSINAAASTVVSVDVPSGLPGDTGKPEGKAVRADITATMSPTKLGTLTPASFEYVGRQFVASVDYPEQMCEEADEIWRLLDDDYVSGILPPRNPAGHKGTFGRLILVGGSRGMTGAPILGAKSALRSGTGLVFTAVPESVSEVVASNLLEALNLGLPDAGGCLGKESLERLLEETEGKDAVGIGPGVGRAETTKRVVRRYLSEVDLPVVLDADGVVAYGGRIDELHGLSDGVLTPHPGELAELLGSSAPQVDANRFKIAPDFAKQYGVTLLLKGVPTVISSPDGATSVVSCPNSGLAKGGSGDVLTGLIGSFLSQGVGPYKAAQIGSWLHCRIGELGAERYGVDSLQPGDLVDFIGSILKEWRKR